MGYLYGDSSPSPLKTNFLELLRQALDFQVHVLLSTERRAHEDERIKLLRRECEVTRVRLEALGEVATQAVEKYLATTEDARVRDCGAQIDRSVAQNLAAANAEIESMLSTEMTRRDERAHQERLGCLEALGIMLMHGDLPDATSTISLEALESGTYAAWLEGRDPMGLEWVVDLAVTDASPFTQHMRVEHFAPLLEVQAPAVGGWLKKEVKVRATRLERLVVTALAIAPGETTFKLREMLAPQTAGYDVVVRDDGHYVALRWVGEGSSPDDAWFEPREDDATKVLELRDALRKAAAPLARRRTKLQRATYRGTAFEEHEDQTPIVHALIELTAPITREIARHSLQSGELVLRRLLGDDRREEIFVSKATLLEKLAPLPPRLAALFEPLALDRPTTMAPAAGMVELASSALESLEPPRSGTVRPNGTGVPGPAFPPKLGPIAAPTELAVPPSAATAAGTPSAQSATSGATQAPDSTSSQLAASGKASAPLVAAVKKIVALAKAGKTDEAYQGYAELFVSDLFAECRLEDQRQALKLMVLPRTPPPASPAVIEAHRAAIGPLQALVNASGEPSDYELLGVCQSLLELREAASSTFKAALAIERARHPGSKLAAELEKRAGASL
jgi:hypothetical protein